LAQVAHRRKLDSEPEGMPKVVKNAGLRWDGESSTLRSAQGREGCWGAAVFQSSRRGFVMKVRSENSSFIMAGIVPAIANIGLPPSAFVHNTSGYHIYFSGLALWGEGGRRSVGLPVRTLQATDELNLRYRSGPRHELAVSLDGKAFAMLQLDIKDAHYLPCVSLLDSDANVQIQDVDIPEHDTDQGCKKMQARIWQDRLFPDCLVACRSVQFPCHRVVLANASAVWRTALESGFREGGDAKLSIDGADPGVVEAMLKYAYIGEFDCDAPAVALRIAHRCEMSELVALCARQMLDGVTVDNVAQLSSTMNLYLEHDEVAKVWPEFLKIIGRDPGLMDAAMRQVGRRVA